MVCKAVKNRQETCKTESMYLASVAAFFFSSIGLLAVRSEDQMSPIDDLILWQLRVYKWSEEALWP
jgi:hypothetical protein